MRIKVNDIVRVIAGDDRGETGKVLSVDHQSGRLIVEGVNRVYKHVRRSQKNPQGGRLSKEMPIQASNVMLVCQKCGKSARLGMRVLGDGSKERFCRSCGASAGEVSPPKTAKTKAKN